MTPTQLKALIDASIYENENREITADVLNQVLTQMLEFSYKSFQRIIVIDPEMGNDTLAKDDARYSFQSADAALQYFTAGTLVIFTKGNHYYKTGNWAVKGVSYFALPGAKVIVKGTGSPFEFGFGGQIVIKGFFEFYAKEGYENSVNEQFPIMVYNQTTEDAIVDIEFESITAQFGCITVRGKVSKSTVKGKLLQGFVDNEGYKLHCDSGDHRFEFDNVLMHHDNTWAGTSGIYLTSPDASTEISVKGHVGLISMTSQSSLIMHGFQTDYNGTGTYDYKRFDITIDRLYIDTATSCCGLYSHRFGGVAQYRIKTAKVFGTSTIAVIDDGAYWNSKINLTIDESSGYSRSIRLNMNTNSDFRLKLNDSRQKTIFPITMINVTSNGTDYGTLRLSGRMRNDNGTACQIIGGIKLLEIDHLTANVNVLYSIDSEVLQNTKILNVFTMNAPTNNINNTSVNSLIVTI